MDEICVDIATEVGLVDFNVATVGLVECTEVPRPKEAEDGDASIVPKGTGVVRAAVDDTK